MLGTGDAADHRGAGLRAGLVRVAAVGVSALLYALAQPPLGLWPLAWLCLAPLFAVAASVRPLAGAALGALFGVLAAAGVSPWLPGMVTDYFQLAPLWAWPATLAAWLAFAGIHFAALLAWIAWASRRGPLHPLLVGAAWSVCELFRASGPVANPWALLAYSQHGFAVFAQLGDLAGPFGIAAVIASFGAALAGVASPALRGARPLGSLAALVVVVLLALGYGVLRGGRPFASGPALPVALVQGAIAREARFAPAHRAENLERHLALTRRAAADAPLLVLWPELALDFYVEAEPELRERLAAETRAFELVAGGLGSRHRGDGRARTNATFLFRDGELVGRTDKRDLMPFSETRPAGAVLALGPDPFAAGDRPQLIHTRLGPLGVATCSEAMHPRSVRRLVRDGAELLANPSNDDWFGSRGAARQQLVAVAMRAIETRRWVLRPTSGGFTALIDPHGRVVTEAPFARPALLQGSVRASRATTLSVRWGDWLPWTALPILVADAARRRGRGARSAEAAT